jgi:hypothetical protein
MPKSKFILDGTSGTYEFSPGKNGSLTYRKNRPDSKKPMFDTDSNAQAKVIGPSAETLGEAVAARKPTKTAPVTPNADQLALRKKRAGVISALAIRG